jgi:hypothetical protein
MPECTWHLPRINVDHAPVGLDQLDRGAGLEGEQVFAELLRKGPRR